MNKEEKKTYLIENYRNEWVETRRKVENELSDQQTLFCVCGKLATGLHERSCRKFQSKVDSRTIELLTDKLPKK